jgi:glycosyltransferase involved in cell wall biosynthesis
LTSFRDHATAAPAAPSDEAAAEPLLPGVRVALVHDWLTGMRGGEKVLEELCAFFPGAPVHTLFHFPGSVSHRIESHPIRTSFLQNAPQLRRRYRSYLPLFPLAIDQFDLTDFDLVLSSSHAVAKGARARAGAIHVCYCHTPMRYVWDQRDAYFPDRSGAVARVRHQVLDALRGWDVRTSARVDLFVANSTFVRERIRRYYDRDAIVVPPPVDVEYFSPAGGDIGSPEPRREPFALMVAALAPYKKVEEGIEACRRLGLELRIVGDGPERARLESVVGSGSVGARSGPVAGSGSAAVRLLGHVPEHDLRELYRTAACFLQPGVEDFGMAAVEALACGCPVVAVGCGGVLDIVEDGVDGLLYPEAEGAEGLHRHIDKALGMHFNTLNLRNRASRFSRQRFRERMRSVLHSTIER